MAKPAYLALRGTAYYFRARVPTDLLEAYGRRIVFVSLGTRLSAAKVRLSEKVAAFHRELSLLRKSDIKASIGLTGTVLHLTDADIEHLCLRYKEKA